MQYTDLTRHEQFLKWLDSSFGRGVLLAEERVLASLMADLSGEYIVWLGHAHYADLPKQGSFKYPIVVSQSSVNERTFLNVEADFHELPFMPYGIDTVVMPHVLEFDSNPYEVLRQAQTLIKPEGCLLIMGFNPLSFWGLRRLFSFKKKTPLNGRFRRACVVREWLKVLNFEIVEQRCAYYQLPLGAGKWFKLFNRLFEWLGRHCLSFFGGVYVIKAKKRLYSITPLHYKRPVFRRLVGDGLMKPATFEVKCEQKD